MKTSTFFLFPAAFADGSQGAQDGNTVHAMIRAGSPRPSLQEGLRL